MRCICDKSSLFPRCIKNPDYCPKSKDKQDIDQDAIWATQISFEE